MANEDDNHFASDDNKKCAKMSNREDIYGEQNNFK